MHICDLCAPHIWGRRTSECHVALVFNTNFFYATYVVNTSVLSEADLQSARGDAI